MTKAELDAIKARASSATPGPWSMVSDLPRYAVVNLSETENGTRLKRIVVPSENHCGSFESESTGCEQQDANFIAHARTDIPLLIAEVERLQEQYRLADLDAFNFERQFLDSQETVEQLQANWSFIAQEHKEQEDYIARLEARLRISLINEYWHECYPEEFQTKQESEYVEAELAELLNPSDEGSSRENK